MQELLSYFVVSCPRLTLVRWSIGGANIPRATYSRGGMLPKRKTEKRESVTEDRFGASVIFRERLLRTA